MEPLKLLWNQSKRKEREFLQVQLINVWLIRYNDLPVGKEFDGKFLKNVKSPPHALPPTPPALH